VEAGKSDGALDNAEERFDRLFAFSVPGFAFFAFEFRLHRQTPGFPDAALGFWLGRQAEVVEMLWGERRGSGTFVAGSKLTGVPHAAGERFEPIAHRSG
jgi:hypothetical protein